MSRLISFAGLMLILMACSREAPTQIDGRFSLTMIVADTSKVLNTQPDLAYTPLKNIRVLLESTSYFADYNSLRRYVAYTDTAGRVEFQNLPAATYTMSVLSDTFYIDPTSELPVNIKLRGFKQIDVPESAGIVDTLKAGLSVSANVVINEIYYCGPPNKSYYFYDQFVELYNTTDETVYLDGIVLCRALQSRHPSIETNDFMQALYVYQFPGEYGVTQTCPLGPKEFAVVAQDAIDHSAYIETAVDLSGAEYEFFNPYGNEPDNPAINVNNILPEKRTDFLINLAHNGIIMATGEDWYYGETSTSGNYQYVHLPISTIIDAVEYSSSSESQKELTIRVDAGFAGIGMTKYSGKSVERRSPGFDTNNSSLDFVVIETPTPGYQHE